MKISEKHLVIVSNRLPIVLEKNNTTWQVRQGSGGLVTALAPVLRNRGGLWIGWPGATDDDTGLDEPLRKASRNIGYKLTPVILNQHEIDSYYQGFSNEIIWPLFHDLQSHCNFDAEFWTCYQDVNKKFAGVIAENTKKNDYIWVHDYHLMTVARELRRMKSGHRVGFFLHIPFPPPDIFLKLPWRSELLNALLEFDLLGFQTLRDRRNFTQCVRTLFNDVTTQGKGQVITVQSREKTIKVGSFPISIDYQHFEEQTQTKEVADSAWYIHENLSDRQIILGIDRLDYTKGIIERLRAFERALVKYPVMQSKVSFIQIVVPSRVHIHEYQLLRTEIEQMVANINGRFTKYAWVPIHYIFRSLDRYELLGYYRTAEIALITPLKDGMNLVAKEYCACSVEEKGVVILSEFAGASAQLQKGAIMVNPYDVESVADAIYTAFEMSRDERRVRMKKLRQSIKKYDVFWWVDSFLQAAFTEKLYSFPVLEDYDYLPQVEISGQRQKNAVTT
jgi:trehalose 6-phosphate synthase